EQGIAWPDFSGQGGGRAALYTTRFHNKSRPCGRPDRGKQTRAHGQDRHRSIQVRSLSPSGRRHDARAPAGCARETPCGPCPKFSMPSASTYGVHSHPSHANRQNRPSALFPPCPSRQRKISGSRPASASAFPCGRGARGRRWVQVASVFLPLVRASCRNLKQTYTRAGGGTTGAGTSSHTDFSLWVSICHCKKIHRRKSALLGSGRRFYLRRCGLGNSVGKFAP